MTKTKVLIFTALFTAFICVATLAIPIPVPFTNGFIHPGDSIIFIAAVLLPLPYAMFAAGAGSMLADLFLGYPHWAIPTLIIKALMALLVHIAVNKTKKTKSSLGASLFISGIWLAFSGTMVYLLNKGSSVASDLLMGELEVTSVEDMMAKLNNTQIMLLGFAIILPLVILTFLWIIGKKTNNTLTLGEILGMTTAGLWMVFAYYIVGSFMYGSFYSSILSIPLNLIQFIVGFFLALIILPFLKKLYIINMK